MLNWQLWSIKALCPLAGEARHRYRKALLLPPMPALLSCHASDLVGIKWQPPKQKMEDLPHVWKGEKGHSQVPCLIQRPDGIRAWTYPLMSSNPIIPQGLESIKYGSPLLCYFDSGCNYACCSSICSLILGFCSDYVIAQRLQMVSVR